ADPHRLEYAGFQKSYLKDEHVSIFVEHPNSIVSQEGVSLIRKVTSDSWKFPHVLRVDSLSNFIHTWAEGDDIFVEPVAPEEGPISTKQIQLLREIIHDDADVRGQLISADSKMALIRIRLSPPLNQSERAIETVSAAEAYVASLRQAQPSFNFYLHGS